MGVFVFQITFSSAFNLGFTQILKVLFYKGGLTPGKQKTTAVIPKSADMHMCAFYYLMSPSDIITRSVNYLMMFSMIMKSCGTFKENDAKVSGHEDG